MPAAARRGLQHDRVADLARGLPGQVERGDGAFAAGHDRHARPEHLASRADLVAHLLDHAPGGPDEDDARLLARLGEAPVLGEEAVAGMDRPGACAASGLEHALDVEIALAGGRGADQDGFVGLARVRPVGVGLGVDGDGADTEAPAGAEDAAGDLPAVGDEDALEHAQAGWDCSILSCPPPDGPVPAAPTAPTWRQRAGLGADVMGTEAQQQGSEGGGR